MNVLEPRGASLGWPFLDTIKRSGNADLYPVSAGLVTDTGTLLVLEHVVMLPSMLVAMLLRREDYSGHLHHHAQMAA